MDELQGRAKADALKIAAGQSSTGQIEELKSNLQQSEEQLQEAEETAWKAKAEASELLFALDQEQVSVKRMNEQIEKMRDETSKLAAEHALALESFQTRLKQQENNVKEENLKSGDVPLPLNGEAKVALQMHCVVSLMIKYCLLYLESQWSISHHLLPHQHPPQVDTSVPNAADAKQPQLQRISDEKSPVSESHGQPLQASLEAAARLSAREEELKVSKVTDNSSNC